MAAGAGESLRAAPARTGLGRPLNQRLATALALQWGNGSRYRLVDRFRHIQQALRDGLMHVSFESLDVRELRWAVPTYGTAKDFQFLLDDRQTRLRDYFGAHGGVRYVSFNVYGVTVQDQWNYIGPWAHVYGTGTGNRPFPAHRQVGGVCGTVSTLRLGRRSGPRRSRRPRSANPGTAPTSSAWARNGRWATA